MDSLIELVVSQGCGYGAQDGDIDAMALDSKRDVIIGRAEAPQFIADCVGWEKPAVQYDDGRAINKADRFEEGYGVVLKINLENWERWLSEFERIDD